MRIAEGLSMLEMTMPLGYGMCPVLVHDESDVVLFDAGLPGQLDVIRGAMKKEGVDFERLSAVLITHQDMDHIGSLSAIAKASGGHVRVMAHRIEKPYIQFDCMPAKMSAERLAEKAKEFKEQTGVEVSVPVNLEGVRILFSNLMSVVDAALEDGQELPFCGGIVAIHTPGHTPGHCCYYLKRYKMLVAGDAMNAENGRLVGPNPTYTKDMAQARASLAKLAAYDIQTVLCYHGGPVSGNVREAIAGLACV
jgi:glyoxylase-like metal-dependent hydrolase (beta-lactamase superfamily II)